MSTSEGEFPEEGRSERLLEDFIYIDRKGKKWFAPAGIIVNGASIDGVLWAVLSTGFMSEVFLLSLKIKSQSFGFHYQKLNRTSILLNYFLKKQT